MQLAHGSWSEKTNKMSFLSPAFLWVKLGFNELQI